MAFDPGLERRGGIILDDAGFDIPEFAVDGRQLGTQVQDCDVHGDAALPTEMVFNGL